MSVQIKATHPRASATLHLCRTLALLFSTHILPLSFPLLALAQSNPRLTHLDVGQNHLRHVPSFRAPALTYLDVSGPALQSLPTTMPHWPELRSLEAAGSQVGGGLRVLPPWLGRLPHVKEIDVSNHCFSNLPAPLEKLFAKQTKARDIDTHLPYWLRPKFGIARRSWSISRLAVLCALAVKREANPR